MQVFAWIKVLRHTCINTCTLQFFMVHGQGVMFQQLPKIYRGWGPDESSSHKRFVFTEKPWAHSQQN